MKTPPYSERRKLSTPRPTASRHGRAPFPVRNAQGGSALITAIVFALIVSITLAGISTLTVSHYALAHTQADSAAALDLAEAGANYELNYITQNGGQSDPPGTTYQASVIDSSLTGSFSVTCTRPDGTAWTGPVLGQKTVVITSSAQVNGALRKVTINGAPTGTFYTTYSVGGKGAYTQFLANGAVVNGISGTNGSFYIDPTLTSKPTITDIVFNGPNAKWTQNPGGYNTVQNKKVLGWDTVTTILNKQFPLGGASYVAMNNDNALATITDPTDPSKQLPGGVTDDNLHPGDTQTVTLHSRPDGKPANYYLSDIYMPGHSNLVLDNTNGPINIYYVAPAGASGGGQYMRGGHALKSLIDAPNNAVKMYVSATSGLGLQPNDANDEVDMGIYAYDSKVVGTKTADFGLVALKDNVNFKGQIISKSISVEGTGGAHITGQEGYFDKPDEYFAFSGKWQELDSNNAIGGGNQ